MSNLFALTDALVSTWRALDGYGAPGSSGVVVFDGPCDTGDVPVTLVVVGARMFGADEDAEPTAGTSDAEWRSLPVTAGSQTESVSVPCAITTWTGDGNGFPDWASIRSTLSGVLDDLRDSVRSVSALGLDGVHYFALTNARYLQEFTTEGAFGSFEFDVEARFNL